MKKNPFKFLVIAVLAIFVAFTGCKDYDDDISSLESKIGALQQALNEIQSKIDGGAVITNVTKTGDGITITLSNGQSYNITNGEDGKDGKDGKAGKDGKDGSVVTIGTNGNWFIDGVDTGMASKGADGKDGIYYVPDDDGFWHKIDPNTDPATDTATDKTWLPEGTITAVWNPGDGSISLFNVEGFDGPYILGAQLLTSLVHYPELYLGGVETIRFRPFIFGFLGPLPTPEDPTPYELDCPIVITPGDEGEIPCIYEMGQFVDLGEMGSFRLIDPGATVKYHVSPSALKEQMIKTDELEVTSHIAEFRLGGMEDEQERNPFKANYIGINNGVMSVKMFMQIGAFMEAYGDILKNVDYFYSPLGGGGGSPGDFPFFESTYHFWWFYSLPNFVYVKNYSPVLALQIPHSEAALNTMPNGADTYVTSDFTRTTIEPIFEIDIAKKQLGDPVYLASDLYPNFLGIKSGGTDVAGVAYDNASNPRYGQYDKVNSDSMYINDNAKALADGMNLIFQWGTKNPELTHNPSSNPLVKGAQDPRIIEVVINTEVDLIDYVQSVANVVPWWPKDADEEGEMEWLPIDLAEYGMEWEFALKDSNDKTIKYELTSNKTDQQQFIRLLDSKKGTIKSKVFTEEDLAAGIDRTPIVRVRILYTETGCTVSEAFIKILFVEKPDAEEEEVIFDLGTYVLDPVGPCDKATYDMTVQQVNTKIYNKLPMSKDKFVTTYGPIAPVITEPDFDGKLVHYPANVDVTYWLSTNTAKGTFKWIVDESTGRTTYLPRFTFDPCDIVWCIGETKKVVTAEVLIYPLDGEDGPTLKLTYKVEYTNQYHLDDSKLIINYWNDPINPEYVVHHTWKPAMGDQNPDNFRFETNINGAFKTHPNRSLMLNETEYVPYKYVFAPADEQPMPKKDLDGTKIEVRIQNDTILQARLAKNLNLLGGETYTKNSWQDVAIIRGHTNTDITAEPDPNNPYAPTGGEDWLNYQETVLAKYLLNRSLEFSKARLQIIVDCGCDTIVEVPFTGMLEEMKVLIRGKNGFNVHFLRPIKLSPTSSDGFIDGPDMGKKGTLINILHLAALKDWHDDAFDHEDNVGYYYEYHGVDTFTVDKSMILCDINLPVAEQTFENATPLPSTLYVAYLSVDQFHTQYPSVAGQDYYGKGTYDWGMVVYDNINTTVEASFNLYIPVSVRYKWGVIQSEYVKVPVVKTHVTENGD